MEERPAVSQPVIIVIIIMIIIVIVIIVIMIRCGGAPCSGSTCHCPWGSSGPTCQQAVQLDRDVRDDGDDDHDDSIDKKVPSVARLVKHRKTMHNWALQLIIYHYSNQNW